MKPVFLSSLSCRLSPVVSLLSSAKVACWLLIAVASLTLAGSASAQQLKVTVTGKITSVENAFNPPYTAPFDSSAAVGTPFTFSYLFNYSGAVDFLSSSPNIGDYRLYGADAGATVAFGNYTFTPSPISFGDFVTYDNYQGTTSDSIELDTSGGTATGFTVPVGQINTGVRVFNQVGLLSSKALPPLSTFSAIDLSKADFVAGVVSNGQSSRVIGSVSSINAVFVAPVPEASTTVSLGVMLGLGGLVLAVRARRRSRV